MQISKRSIIIIIKQQDESSEHTLRGIVATPIDEEVAKPMPQIERFIKNIQTEVTDLGEDAKQHLLFTGHHRRSSSNVSVGGVGGGNHHRRSSSNVSVSQLQQHFVDEEEGGMVGPQDTSLTNTIDKGVANADDSFTAIESNPNQMYLLQATRGSQDMGCIRRSLHFCNACINCGAVTQSATEQNMYLGGFPNPNQIVIDFFFWMFRKGWTTVIVLSVVWYYAFVILFAAFIVWAAEMDNDCVRVGGIRSGDLDRSLFMDAFSLSWNTFSTVGYGSTSPAVSHEGDEHGDSRCAFVHFITSFEAFVGLLYAGFSGAIFFAKLTRITQHATVRFSDPLTVRYGSGVDFNLVDDDEDKPEESNNHQKTADDDGYDTKDEDEKRPMTPLEKFNTVARKVTKKQQSPFPVITFRIANEMHDVLGGEIISASVNAVVLIESTKYEDQVSEDLTKQINMHRLRRESTARGSITSTTKLRKTVSQSRLFLGGESERNLTERTTLSSVRSTDDMARLEENETSSSLSLSENSRPRSADSNNAMTYLQVLNSIAHRARSSGSSKKMKIDEEEDQGGADDLDNSSRIVPRMVFTKLKLETSEHPLFKRIWRFKHVIDQDSPLLTPEAQRAIMNNGGTWPEEWNHAKAVRKAIRFNQMVVSFTGISNISGASVYKQKVYDYVDIVVGYQFCNALYRGRLGALKVDLALINDVIEQNGGGGEPLNVT